MKSKLLKSTFILLIGGLITKIFSMLIKITTARYLSPDSLGVFMLIMPTFSLLINLSQFGLPLALSKLISEQTRNNKKLVFSILPILITINIILMITIIVIAPFISNNLLHNNNTYIPILSMALVIPFTSISSICRSYFFGKEKMIPHVTSNICEDLVRFVILLLFLPHFIKLDLEYTITFLILVNIVSELTSTIILIFFLPKNIEITKNDLKPNKRYMKDSLKISIPNSSGRLIGSISYFFEPIILTNMLLYAGYSTNYITHEYGIISGYVNPILLLPSFFTLAISQAMLPVISREYIKGNKKYVYNKIKLTVLATLIAGSVITLVLMLKADTLLEIIYHTKEGINYLRILAPIFLLQYIQSPLSFSLDAIGKSKDNFYASVISVTTRILSLVIFSLFHIGIYALIASLAINIIITSLYQLKRIKYHFT